MTRIIWKDTLYSDDTACAGTGGSMMRTTGGKMWTEGGLPAATENNNVVQHWLIPNPASNNTVLMLERSLGKQSTLRVYDVNGRTVQSIDILGNETQIKLDCSKMSSGLYFYSNTESTVKGKFSVIK